MQFKETLLKNKGKVLIIHYACSDIYVESKAPPKISCIVIRDDETNKDEVFSRAKYSEKTLLENFWKFVSKNKDKIFLGWNIKSHAYSFVVLKDRYERLCRKKATKIHSLNVFDLDDCIKKDYNLKRQIYRLKELAELNGHQTRGFIQGEHEAKLFKEKKFVAIEGSVIRKTHVISDILDSFLKNRLIVSSNIRKRDVEYIENLLRSKDYSVACILTTLHVEKQLAALLEMYFYPRNIKHFLVEPTFGFLLKKVEAYKIFRKNHYIRHFKELKKHRNKLAHDITYWDEVEENKKIQQEIEDLCKKTIELFKIPMPHAINSIFCIEIKENMQKIATKAAANIEELTKKKKPLEEKEVKRLLMQRFNDVNKTSYS